MMESRFFKWLPYFLVAASLCACSRYVEGDVFLDKNANNVRDFGESVVSGMPFTVTRNDSALKTGVTDSVGHFLVPVASTDIGSSYCVQVSSADVAAMYVVPAGDSNKALAIGNATPAPTPQATADACPTIVGHPDCDNANCCDNAACASSAVCKDKNVCTKLSGGTPDCTDPDCCDESACSTAAACKDDTADTSNACPRESNGDPKCSDSRCSGEVSCNTATVKPLQACDKSKAAAMTLNLDVPITVDYATRVGKIAKTELNEVAAGDQIGLEITYPSSCTFDAYLLPAAFIPVNMPNDYDAATRELSLSKAVSERPSQLLHNDHPPFGHDELFTYILPLKVVGTGSMVDVDYSIKPTVTCPDGKQVPASETVVHVKADQGFSLSSEISPGCPALGESSTIHAFISNQGHADFTKATYTLAIAGGDTHLLETVPSPCKNKGTSVECDLAALDGAASKELTFTFTMDASVSSPTTITFTPKLDVDGTGFGDSAISCSYP